MTAELSTAILDIVERDAAWGAAQLEALTGFLPGGEWSADLDAGRYRAGEREIRIAVLGTFDSQERTWMWGWANPGLEGRPVVRLTEELARHGREHGIAELGTGQLDLARCADPRLAAETLAFAGMAVLGTPGYIGVPAHPGTQVYFVPDDPQVPRATLDPVTLPRMLTTGASLIGRSARRTVTGYFTRFGVPFQEEAARVTARLPDGSTVEVDLDDADRIAGVRVSTAAGAGATRATGPTGSTGA